MTEGALDEAEYATRVEEAFIAERGTPFLLSAKDWSHVKAWREKGIPVDTVVRAIQETFEKRRARGVVGKISSVSYCANAIEERWELERRGLVGKRDPSREAPAEGAGSRLERVASSLEEAARRTPEGVDAEIYAKAVEKALSKVKGLPADGSFDDLESALSAVESSLSRKLEKALDEKSLSALRARVDEALGDASSMSPEVLERTRRALVRREVRRATGLPPLTLFDL